MKKFIAGFIIGAVLFGSAVYAEENYRIVQNTFPIIVNGTQEKVEALNINGTTWIRLGSIAGILGADAKFDEVNKQIEITGGERKLTDEQIKAIDEANAKAEAEAEKKAAEKRAQEESRFYDKDGHKMVMINNKEFIYDVNLLQLIQSINKEYGIWGVEDNGQTRIELRKGDKVLIKSVEMNTLNHKPCIEYTYYTNTILPLIQ